MDFDGDSRPDLLSGSNCCTSSGFHLFRRKVDGPWEPRRDLAVTPGHEVAGIQQRSRVTAADFDGDGVPDLLIRAAYGKGIRGALGPFEAGGPVLLSQSLDLQPALGTDDSVGSFAVADWDGDGKPDLIAYLSLPGGREGIYWHRNLGGPGLTRLAERQLLLGVGALKGERAPDARVYGFCVGDWDGDGRPDLLVTRHELTPPGPDGKQHWRGSIWLYRRE